MNGARASLPTSSTHMSSSVVKSRLKASREAIQAKEWEKVVDEANGALEYEGNNYNAQVFRGLALLHLKRYEDSEQAYRAAVKSQPTQLLAWQGLEKFYTERKAWDQVADVLFNLMDIALERYVCGQRHHIVATCLWNLPEAPPPCML